MEPITGAVAGLIAGPGFADRPAVGGGPRMAASGRGAEREGNPSGRRELHESVLRFVLKNQRLGRALESAVKAHDESIGAFDEGVLRKGRRFADLVVGGVDESQLQVEAVEGQVRVSKCALAEVGALDERSTAESA